MESSAIADYADRYRQGSLSGAELAVLEKDSTITKTDRRNIIKLAKKGPPKELTDRQKWRLQVKEKKATPKTRMTAEERREKFSDLDEQRMEREKDASQYVICLGCRRRGHYLKDCPETQYRGALEKPGLICFNCGARDHALRACTARRDPKGKLPYATCFVCNGKGHLSRDCPENANGLYPKGGCCHICLQKDHLVKDCPARTEEDKANWIAEQEKKAREKEEKALGPKISGLTADEGDGDHGAEYMAPTKTFFADSDDDNDEEGAGKKRKGSKKEKKNKKSRH
eukprot:GSChrysophyteH2.ASY1.ANO1.614.1 assembled CDS